MDQPTRPKTKLDPLKEVLFQAWARANGVDNHDAPDNQFDHRALFSQTNGHVHTRGAVNDMSTEHNDRLEQHSAAQEVAKKQQAEREKEASEQLKKQEDAANRDLEIQKTHQTLQHLLMRKRMGL